MPKKKYLQSSDNEKRGSKEIITPKNKVLYVDLDGTLIDGKYQITSNEIYAAVNSLQNNGWIIGLSSDTPLESLRTWKHRFGMNGDIIAERGSIIEIEDQVFENKEDIELFQSALRNIKKMFASLGCQIWEGNTVEFLRVNESIGNSGDTVILINQHRAQSIGLYVRKNDEQGNLQIDINLTNKMVDSIRQFFPTIEDLNEDLNHDYGILILSRKSVVKRLGTINAMNRRSVIQIGMIGNSMTDFVGSDIAIHYAVGNASLEFKNVADHIANEPLTEGVVEILCQLGQCK